MDLGYTTMYKGRRKRLCRLRLQPLLFEQLTERFDLPVWMWGLLADFVCIFPTAFLYGHYEIPLILLLEMLVLVENVQTLTR